ncbi:MAG: hypothetical protein V4635_00135 [Bacteroidota bacterium]
MNIEQRLTVEHSRILTMAIVNYIGAEPTRFKELMIVFLNGEYRLTQRAAWPLSYVCIAEPQLLKPYFSKLIGKLKAPGNHPAIKRNILRIFQEIDIPEKYQSAVIDECFKLISDPAQTVAVMAFAITVATRLCKPYPELKRELLLVLQHLATHPQTPAITVRIKRAMKDLT